MEELHQVAIYLGLGGAAVVAALIELVKRTLGLTDSQWMRVVPGLALVLGMAWNALVASLTDEVPLVWNIIVFLGILTGLAAIGLYSGQRAARGS